MTLYLQSRVSSWLPRYAFLRGCQHQRLGARSRERVRLERRRRCVGDKEPLQNRENITEGAARFGKLALLHSDTGQSITIAEVQFFFLPELTSAVQEPVHVGTAQAAGLHIHGEDVLEEHAIIEWKNGQLMLTALGGDPEDLFSESYTSIDENSLRCNVPYLVSCGAVLRFGSNTEPWKVEYKEKTNVNPFTRTLLQTMVSNFSEEGKESFRKLTGM